MNYFQFGLPTILSPLRRLSGFLRYIWRFAYYVCRWSLSVCTCNCTCWFRRQISLDRIYDRLQSKGKGNGKNKCKDNHLQPRLPQQEILHGQPGHMMFSLRAGHLQILAPRALSMAALLQAHRVIRLHLLDGLASFQSCNIFKYALHISRYMQGGLFETCSYLPQQR